MYAAQAKYEVLFLKFASGLTLTVEAQDRKVSIGLRRGVNVWQPGDHVDHDGLSISVQLNDHLGLYLGAHTENNGYSR